MLGAVINTINKNTEVNREVGLEVNEDRTNYVVMFRH
jgi:hypothetical protein